MIRIVGQIAILVLGFYAVFAQQTDGSSKSIPLVSDVKPKVISLPKPEFPQGGINVKGTVSVIVTIDEQGNVVKAEPISGHPLLRPFAEKAAMMAKFEPVSLGGKPIKIRFPIAYNFVLDEATQSKPNEEKSQRPKNIVRVHPRTILIGKAIKLYKPPFPKNCRCKFSKNKKVIVQFVVDENGNVESAKGIAGHPLVRVASEIAVKKSKFSISRVNGLPVKAFGLIIYDFVLSRQIWKTIVVKYELKPEKNN
jgi:hypothetical protein